MWLIVGTLPDLAIGLERGHCRCQGDRLYLPSGACVPVERGTACLIAVTTLVCEAAGLTPPEVCVAGDTGKGDGSRAVYAALMENAVHLAPAGVTFHYLFPDVDWHNRVLMALQEMRPSPVLVADAGFMYVAKMSGYADYYTLFTPDVGEMAFLADEKAPHPFYTRGFLLAEEGDVPKQVQRARAHGNCPRYLLVKGHTDILFDGEQVLATVSEPCEEAMEAVGGTGDLVTALVTAALMHGLPVGQAAVQAARAARQLAALVRPTPATQVGEFLQHIPGCVSELLQS